MNPILTGVSSLARGASRTGGTREHADDGAFELALGVAAAGVPAQRHDVPEHAKSRDDAPREDRARDTKSERTTRDAREGRDAGDVAQARDARAAHDAAREDVPMNDAPAPGAPTMSDGAGTDPTPETRNAAVVANAGAQNVPASPPAAVPDFEWTVVTPVPLAEVLGTRVATPDVPATAASDAWAATANAARVAPAPLPVATPEGASVRVVASRVTPRPAAAPARTTPRVPVSVPASADATGARIERVVDPFASPLAPVGVDADGATPAAEPATPAAPVTLANATPARANRAPLAPAARTDAAVAEPVDVAPPASESPAHAATPADEDAPHASAPAPAPAPDAAPTRDAEAPRPAQGPRASAVAAPHAAAPRGRDGERSATSEERGEGSREPSLASQGIAAPETDASAAGANAAASTAEARTIVPRDGAAATTPANALADASALTDARFEPLRRAADQVTLQFQGEGGLEGRLRIAVRGETVHATLLSSHEGTLQRLGGETGALRRALGEQGFSQARIAVHDLRGNGAVAETADARENARGGEDRRQGEPQRRPGQGRDSRQDAGSGSERRTKRDERRSE